MKFSYERIGQEMRIDRVEEPEAVVVIPEELDGCPVVELGAYALSKSAVEEVHLPSRLRKIGAYAFYGCESLKRIYCHGRALDLGAGLFADAGNVEFLDITLYEGEKSCFKELLSELRQTLRVQVHTVSAGERQEARLIFPEYYEEMVENTPARILFIETHGCGHRYRYCFVNLQFQYRGYDELFPHVKVQESEELVTELALGRLLFPCGLTAQHEAMYSEYVKEHWRTAGQLLIAADSWQRGMAVNLEPGGIPWLAETFAEQAAQAEELIAMAQQAGDTEAVSWLMDYRRRRFGGDKGRKRRFEL